MRNSVLQCVTVRVALNKGDNRCPMLGFVGCRTISVLGCVLLCVLPCVLQRVLQSIWSSGALSGRSTPCVLQCVLQCALQCVLHCVSSQNGVSWTLQLTCATHWTTHSQHAATHTCNTCQHSSTHTPYSQHGAAYLRRRQRKVLGMRAGKAKEILKSQLAD